MFQGTLSTKRQSRARLPRPARPVSLRDPCHTQHIGRYLRRDLPRDADRLPLAAPLDRLAREPRLLDDRDERLDREALEELLPRLAPEVLCADARPP